MAINNNMNSKLCGSTAIITGHNRSNTTPAARVHFELVDCLVTSTLSRHTRMTDGVTMNNKIKIALSPHFSEVGWCGMVQILVHVDQRTHLEVYSTKQQLLLQPPPPLLKLLAVFARQPTSPVEEGRPLRGNIWSNYSKSSYKLDSGYPPVTQLTLLQHCKPNLLSCEY